MYVCMWAQAHRIGKATYIIEARAQTRMVYPRKHYYSSILYHAYSIIENLRYHTSEIGKYCIYIPSLYGSQSILSYAGIIYYGKYYAEAKRPKFLIIWVHK